MMLKPIHNKFKGVITISGPTKSGKSQLAEFLIKEQESITYIATSQPRTNDPEWNSRIKIHRSRRPDSWHLIENPIDICSVIESIENNSSILIDSLGGIVEKYLVYSDSHWKLFQSNFIKCLINSNLAIIVVAEEIGWGIVPATQAGHLFRERHTNLTSLVSSNSSKRWLALNGIAIDLDNIGSVIP
tara:strand:+ start:232 stop:792 length:561 start_codon:yes stop_codon:yes gene_type:complete